MPSRRAPGFPTASRALTRVALLCASLALVGWFALCTVLSPQRVAATVEAALAAAVPEPDPADRPGDAPAPGQALTDPELPALGLPTEVQGLVGDPGLRAAVAREVAGVLEPGPGASTLGPATERAALAAGLGADVASELAARMDAFEPPSELRWAATARSAARVLVPVAAVTALLLLGVAAALATRPSMPLRRAGWWAIRASLLPLAAALVRRLAAGDGDGVLGGALRAGASMGAALVPTALALLAAGVALHVGARVLDGRPDGLLEPAGRTGGLAAAGGCRATP